MIKGLFTEALYGVNSTAKSFNDHYPGEQILFSSAATFMEVKKQSRRGIARRGVIIITENQIFFKSVPWSLYSLVYLIGALLCFLLFLASRNFICLIGSILIGAMMGQRLPFLRRVPVTRIDDANLETSGKESYRLRVAFEDRIAHFVFSDPLPNEIKEGLRIVYE